MIRHGLRLFVLAFSVLVATIAPAVEGEIPGDDPVVEKRLSDLSEELRCLVCQNQSIADSHADLAIDLKNQIREMIVAGKSDEEIKSYLTQRYGDFVLYRPPVKGSTWLLWGGPFVLLATGVFILIRVMRRRRAIADAEGAAPLGEAERSRVRQLLASRGAQKD